MLNEKRQKTAQGKHVDLATCSAGVPNAVPVAFKDVTDDGKIVVGDVFLDTTLRNLAANDGRIAISVYDAKTLEGYQIRGTAEYVADGRGRDHVQGYGRADVPGRGHGEGALIITPETVIVTRPARRTKKVL